MLWLLLAAVAAAVEVPVFAPGTSVYLSPPDLAFPTRQVGAIHPEHPVYVVVYGRVLDGPVPAGRASATEAALEETWAAWALAPGSGAGAFDPVEGSLVVLGLDDREVRVRCGSRWDTTLGLHNDALLPLIDTGFIPLASAGDLDGGLAGLVTAVDGAITAGLARKEREARAALEAAERAAVEAAQAAERADQAEKAAAHRRQLVATGLAVGIPATGAASVFGVAGVFVLSRRRRATDARRRFEQEAGALRGKLERAESAIAELTITVETRDQIVALRLRGARTTAVVEEVTTLLDEIRLGLAGLRARLTRIEPLNAGVLASAPWDEATAALGAPFDYDTGELRTELFGEPTRVVRLDPQRFMGDLEEKWARASGLWQRALDAVAASLRTAAADLPADDLDRMKQALGDAGLPVGWIADHPLLVDATGTWAELDALRVADPVAYLDRLDDAIALDDELEARVAELIGGLDAARAARAEADALDVNALDTVPPAELDPAVLAPEADRALESLVRRLQQPGDPAVASQAAQAAITAAEALRDARRAIDGAVRTGAATVAAADREVRLSRERLDAHQVRARALLARHSAESMAAVWTELSEAGEDVREGETALGQARAALDAREHVRAVRLAEQATREVREAEEDLGQLVAALERVEGAEREATALWAELDSRRSQLATELVALGGLGHALDHGDQLRSALHAEWAGTGDWTARAARVREISQAWSAAVGARREENRRRERERREAAARAAAASRRTSHASSAFSRSFSSSGRTGSSYASSRSSTRSSSRSYSSSSRSAGRSFGGGGRSGGRKF